MKKLGIVITCVILLVIGNDAHAGLFGKIKHAVKSTPVSSVTEVVGGSGSSGSSVDDSEVINGYLNAIYMSRKAMNEVSIALGLKEESAHENAGLESLKTGGVGAQGAIELISRTKTEEFNYDEIEEKVKYLDDAQKAKASEAISAYAAAQQSQSEKSKALKEFIVKYIASVGKDALMNGMDLNKGIGTAGDAIKRKQTYQALAKEMDSEMAHASSQLSILDRVKPLLENGKGALSKENLSSMITDSDKDTDLDEEGDLDDSDMDSGSNITSEEPTVKTETPTADAKTQSSVDSLQLGVVEDDSGIDRDPEYTKGFKAGAKDRQAGTKKIDPSWSAQYMIGYEDGYQKAK